MTAINTSMFKAVIFMVIFLSLWATFQAFFIGSQIGDTSNMGLTEILGMSWNIITQPEILFLNSILILVGLVITLVFIRELLPA